jgi:hypothetical protein
MSLTDIVNELLKISDSLSKGDNIETSIYTDQNWYLQNIHCFYTCLNTIYWLNRNNKKEIPIEDIKFSSDLNKTSLKNINKKNILNLLKIIPNKSNQEILMINNISNFLIQNNKENELIKILQEYKDITIKDVELFIKIDKNIPFTTLENKDKKRISKHL